MLAYYDLSEYYDITREWYDGYKIGRANVYNPWDVINWCNQLLMNLRDFVLKLFEKKIARDGYYDIAIEIEDEEIGIIIEVKDAENAEFEQECDKALKQINDNDYTAGLKDDGMRTLLKYGIACYKSRCKVVLEREEYIPT